MMRNNLVLNSVEERALSLLGQGIEPKIVASAIGISESRISQLLSDANFAAEVAELRYISLAKHNERDNAYDGLEDTLLKKLQDCIPYMMKPLEILAAIKVINGAKRRGSSAPASLQQAAPVTQLLLPIQIIQQFQVDSKNQVVKAGAQELITVQSGQMKNLLEAASARKELNVPILSLPTESITASN